MQEEIDAIDAVSRAVDRIERQGRFAKFTLTNGIVLKLKTIPPLLLTAVYGEFPDPDPPMVMIEEKGREEPNPNDPMYVKELEKLEEVRTMAVNDLVLAIGSVFVSAPEGYYGPDDDGWIADVEFATSLTGHTIEIAREDKVKRYLQWLRFYALESSIDIAVASSLHHQLTGIREGEVAEVIESFQRDAGWGANSAGNAEEAGANGNTDNRASRRSRPRSRRA